MKIKIKDLRPNPFLIYPENCLDRDTVEYLKSSMRTTGIWDNMIVRQCADGYELAYGYHRLIALKELINDQILDEDYELDLPVQHLDDSAMVRIMAAEKKMCIQSVLSVVKYISKECRIDAADITASDISAFTGSNWTEQKVKRILKKIGKNRDKWLSQTTPQSTS